MQDNNLYIQNEAIEAVNNGTDTPAFLRDFEGNRAWKLVYHKIDGWRGYQEAEAVKKWGWSKIDYDGWVTGNWSDAPEESQSDNVEAKLNRLAKEYGKKGYKLTAVFSPTSNVFSTSFDVFVKKFE